MQKQTYMLSEFLEQKTHDYRAPQLRRKAVVHGHCHHKSTLDFNSEENLMKKMSLDYNILDSGCCGMAGAFGYESEHYDVGIKCGERVLLPAVRSAPSDTLIIADGFSCREQILQETERRGVHLAQVMQMAIRGDRNDATTSFPEREYTDVEKTPAVPMSLIAGGAALTSTSIWWLMRHRD